MSVRPAAVAGSWYPASAARLEADVRAYLDAAGQQSPSPIPEAADLLALVAPHAGLMYSGPVAAHAYRLLQARSYDTVVLVGPSHRVAFDGVSIWPQGAWETPLGPIAIDDRLAALLMRECPIVHTRPEAHAREHSLEMQLPFLAAIAPGVRILPLVMGHQTRATAFALGECLGHHLPGRVLLVASSDLSHFFDARTADALDAQVAGDIDRLDWNALMSRIESRPDHACGGGPIVSVLKAAAIRGATGSRVLWRADSGDVSGDTRSVVGYLAAAAWR